MKIQITSKNIYGNDLLYPACETSYTLLKLTRKKTFDIQDLMNIRKLGYEININGYVPPEAMAVLV